MQKQEEVDPDMVKKARHAAKIIFADSELQGVRADTEIPVWKACVGRLLRRLE
jgi:hypothetical protein